MTLSAEARTCRTRIARLNCLDWLSTRPSEVMIALIPVLVAATSGISAIITSDGRVLSQSRQFSRAILVRQVRASAAITLADRLGELPEWILAAAGIGAAAAGVWLLATPDGSRRRQEV